MNEEDKALRKKFMKIVIALFLLSIIWLGIENGVRVSEETEGERYALKSEEESDHAMPKITKIIIGTDYYIALCEDKTIWSWGNNSTGKLGTDKDSVMEPQKITDLEGVVKIIDGGKNIYALLDNGDVYIWGRKLEYLFLETKKDHILYKPVKLEGLEHIVDIDARNNTMFALDQNGNLYALGLQCFWNGPEADIFQVFTGPNEKLGKDIAGIFAGAGNYHYFLRKDGTVFSIMEYFYDGLGTPYAFIFPHCDDSGFDILGLGGYYFPEELEGITILNEYTKEGYTVFYDLAGINEVELVSSDNYTVFIGKEDGTLWFWDSDRIKYHDDSQALANPEDGNEYCEGILVEIDISHILQTGGDLSARPYVTDMQSGLENTVFLTNTGEVFISRYTTYQVEDVSFYRRSNPDPGRLPSVETIEDMDLKTLAFEKLELKDIISIATDGDDMFSAVDVNGAYYIIK